MADIYSEHAERFFAQYHGLDFEDLHRAWLLHLPERPGFALDVGAGTGRDAIALAERGWEVLAAEPADRLRAMGEQATTGYGIQWAADRLPELAMVRAHSYRFDLILVSAVWMHVAPAQRERAFRVLADLLAPGGTLVITLRHGPSHDERSFHETDRDELETLARRRALVTLHAEREDDQLGRDDVWWETLVFRLPDDGTGGLPLLRHIIVNDDKSSTYKLGLLRAVTRIADSVPGMVLKRTDEWVEIPLGLVGLYWIKLYQPLILRHELRQLPGRANYAFASDDFHALADVSPLDLSAGRPVKGEFAATVLRAVRDACRTITNMPAHYITHPGSERQIFQTDPKPVRIKPGSFMLDRETLTRFGRFRVPAALWDCCSRYACWLDPAIVNEWSELMQGYNGVRYNSDVFQNALRWEEGRRDTTPVRRLVEQRVQDRQDVRCIWSDSSLLRRAYDVDHCFPWSRWSNNDLWNLLPATTEANARKGEKIPAAPLLQSSRARMLQWWNDAFIGTEREEQFFTEAEAALPMVTKSQNLESLFEGLAHQRMRLKMNQQLAEWYGLR
ncbi:methyltransferase domain-containing protein [Halofilum ochraceum]|uniref:methyltransferase domain-containing protein n=1 Tax=Halofilum ochraceum TaxID=1611323 RepID=UPI0008D8FB76|nr:methyltransferase domain-containing protein [Halofilum ochraceum]